MGSVSATTTCCSAPARGTPISVATNGRPTRRAQTLDDALHIRRRLLLAFERAEAEPDPAKRAAWLHFAIVGGGPTGVELAGTLAEIARHTLRREFRNIDPTQAKVR